MSAQIGQVMTMGLPGPELDEELRDFIRQYQPGGFILFGRNIESPSQLRELTSELVTLCEVPPIITVDQEGGRVSRLAKITAQPPFADDLRRARRSDLIEWHGRLMARLLAAFGFNLNLAPVVDMLIDPELDNSLYGRCLGSRPEETVQNARLWMRAHRAEGVGVTIKHFPGYSLCPKDPHGALPVLNRSREEMDKSEFIPFRELLAETDAVMVGHAFYPQLASDGQPSSLSRAIVSDLLKKEMGCQALVMTDDLEMGAVASNYSPADLTRRAMHAGNDLLLFCHDREMVEFASVVLEREPTELWQPAAERVLEWKKNRPQPAVHAGSATVAELTAEIEDLNAAVSSALADVGDKPFVW